MCIGFSKVSSQLFALKLLIDANFFDTCNHNIDILKEKIFSASNMIISNMRILVLSKKKDDLGKRF